MATSLGVRRRTVILQIVIFYIRIVFARVIRIVILIGGWLALPTVICGDKRNLLSAGLQLFS